MPALHMKCGESRWMLFVSTSMLVIRAVSNPAHHDWWRRRADRPSPSDTTVAWIRRSQRLSAVKSSLIRPLFFFF